jgi:hypothetical protein
LYDLKYLGKANAKYIEPTLEKARSERNARAQSRMMYAKQRIVNLLAFKDQEGIFSLLRELLKDNTENIDVCKYFVKTFINSPKFGYLLDIK